MLSGMGKKKKKQKLKHRPLPLLLKPLRKRMKLSQAELGEKLGVSDATINRIEKGKQNWNQEFLQDAAAVLGCHWFDLLPLEAERDRARAVLRAVA